MRRPLLAIVAALVLAGSAYAAKPRVVGIGEQHDGENAKAHVGDTLVVTVGANPATGRWRLGAFNRRILRFDSTGSVRSRTPLVEGARAITIFTFKVLARGATPLRLNYVSKANKVVKDFSVRIVIEPPED